MCSTDCVRPRDIGLSAAALDTLAGLYEHPVVRILAGAFKAAGGQLFVVGGPVRDALRGHADFADLDFTTNLRPDQTRRVLRPLGTLWTAGERFGTIGVSIRAGDLKQKVEVTTFRTEVYTPGSRKPTIGFGDNIGDDLRRRDLTVNAVAMNVVDGCLVDPFGGIDALAGGVLVTPDNPVTTLSEDPLRILRAVRFAAKLKARLAPELEAAVSQTRDRLSIVSADRKLEELDKLAALGGPAFTNGLLTAARLTVLDAYVPGADPDRVMPSGLCHTTEETLAVLLARLGVTDLEPQLRAMRLPTTRIRRVVMLRELTDELRRAGNSVPEARRILRTADDATLAAVVRVYLAVHGKAPAVWDTLVEVRDTEPGVRDPLPVGGNDLVALGLKGRDVGAALATLERKFCLDGRLLRDDALVSARSGIGA